MRFDQLVHAHQFFQALGQFNLDGFDRCQHTVAGCHIVARGVNGEARNFLTNTTREWVKQLQAFNFVVKQFNANGQLRMFGRKHIDGVATHAKFATGEVVVVAFVLHAHQLRDHITLPHFVAGTHGHDHAVVAFGFTDTVNS